MPFIQIGVVGGLSITDGPSQAEIRQHNLPCRRYRSGSSDLVRTATMTRRFIGTSEFLFFAIVCHALPSGSSGVRSGGHCFG
jgi:hypothetical protein